MFPQYNKKLDFAPLSFSCSILRPITCFHSMTKNVTSLCSVSVSIPSPVTCFHRMPKNFTSLHSVSVVQSQVPLHVSIEWQKTSLHCTQFQFFNPNTCYMYPMAYIPCNSFQPSMKQPHIKFIWESTFEGHVDHCWFDIGYVVHYHYHMYTMNFPWSTQNTFALSIPIMSSWTHNDFSLSSPMISSWAHNFPLSI